jgi:carbon starvation protein
LFILTTLDAGTRVGRFMLQDLLGNLYPPMGRTSWYPSVLFTSTLVVAAWGYFLYTGTIDPLGGINSLWPLFGISNQMLAAIALCVATTVIVKRDKEKLVWVTLVPLAWLVTMTSWAAWEKLFSPEFRVGFFAHAAQLKQGLAAGTLPPDIAAVAPQLIFNNHIDAALTVFFLAVTWIMVFDTARVCLRWRAGRRQPPLSETPYVPTVGEAEILPQPISL